MGPPLYGSLRLTPPSARPTSRQLERSAGTVRKQATTATSRLVKRCTYYLGIAGLSRSIHECRTDAAHRSTKPDRRSEAATNGDGADVVPTNLAAHEAGRNSLARSMRSRAATSRRDNVDSPADSEVNGRTGVHHRKAPCAGKLLEAAIGVEPMMEVLQTSALPLGYAASAQPLSSAKGRRQSTWPLSSASSPRGGLERVKGLEPSTFCMASRRSSQLSYTRSKAA